MTTTTMKMALVCVLLGCAALLSMVSAKTCARVYECSAAGGSCMSEDTTVRHCAAGLYERSYFNMTTYTQTCTCSTEAEPTVAPTVAPSYTLGQACNSSQYWEGHSCRTSPLNGITETRWFSVKRIGDVCSSSDFDCHPPRKCVSGKCQGNLAEGAVCYNTTFSRSDNAYGICVHSTFCERYSQTTGLTQDLGRCKARLAAGASCSTALSGSRIACANGLECYTDINAASSVVVGACNWGPNLYFLDGGVKANSSNQCKSGLLNYTDNYRTCLAYEPLLALTNERKGKECNYTTDCGDSPDTFTTLSTCECNGMGTSNTAVCTGYYPSTPAQLQATRTEVKARMAARYAAGCESQSERSSYPFDSITNNWCYRFDYAPSADTTRDAYCAREIAQLNAGVKDCDGSILNYCGALHTMSMSVGVLLALIVAALVGAN